MARAVYGFTFKRTTGEPAAAVGADSIDGIHPGIQVYGQDLPVTVLHGFHGSGG
jgi:hypothetical protein